MLYIASFNFRFLKLGVRRIASKVLDRELGEEASVGKVSNVPLGLDFWRVERREEMESGLRARRAMAREPWMERARAMPRPWS